MEKTKKQKSINKVLTLMLAFVMVFTGMGIGSWGVSEAWADETPFSIADDAGNLFAFNKLGFFGGYLYYTHNSGHIEKWGTRFLDTLTNQIPVNGQIPK